MKIEKVYRSTTDGFIVIITPHITYRYEGMNLVPNHIKKWIKANPDKCLDKDLNVFDD